LGDSPEKESRFTYSTITSPLDYNHPVSGNREFGIFANPTGGGYTFYTMGVDRTSDWKFAIGNATGYGFSKADELWTNIQKNMAAYINANGGSATVQTPIIARPNWNAVKNYLMGKISFATLKAQLGC
jgi:hypothetical protein